LIALLPPGAPLRAQDPSLTLQEEPANVTRYGIFLGAATPLLEFRDASAKTGKAIGFLAERNLGPHAMIQTRLDYVQYPETRDFSVKQQSQLLPRSPLSFSANTFTVSAEIRHHLDKIGLHPVYLSGGISAVRYEFRSSGLDTAVDQNGVPLPGIVRIKAKTSVKMGLTLGAGYEFSPSFSLYTRYSYTTLDRTALEGFALDRTSLASLQTGLSVRF
jgi:hypothetical protein